MKKLVLLLTAVFLFTSCVVTSNLDLQKNNCDTEIKATPFFSEVIEDLASFTRNPDGKSLMQNAVESFAERLGECPSVYSVSFEDDSEISFEFADFKTLVKELTDEKNQNVLTFEDNCLNLNINMDNYSQVKEMVPFLALEDIAVYCAEYNEDYSEEEYLTMMEFIAGPDSREGILSSYVSLVINTPSEVKDTNGNLLNADTVEFRFPLIDFLLLHSPISFYCKF